MGQLTPVFKHQTEGVLGPIVYLHLVASATTTMSYPTIWDQINGCKHALSKTKFSVKPSIARYSF